MSPTATFFLFFIDVNINLLLWLHIVLYLSSIEHI